MDASNVSNRAETAGMSDIDSTGTYLGIGDAKRSIEVMDCLGGHMDASSGNWDLPHIDDNVNRTTNTPKNVSIRRKRGKLLDSPIDTVRQILETECLRDHADA